MHHSIDGPAGSHIRHDSGNVDVSYGYGWIVATHGGNRIEARHGGREDWLANNIIRDFANGDILITMAYDNGPDSDGMSVAACKALVGVLKQYGHH